jgi:branched-chain amino acid transport system ATP-binding protein
MSLELDSVVKRFGGVEAVAGISLELPENKMVGLMGPNGSGKSTLFHVVAGYHRPTSGRVIFNGSQISGQPAHKVARQGVVRTFQQRMVFEGMDVRENVLTAIQLNQSGERVDELLGFVGLGDYAQTLARNLPYGFARNLSVAMALAASPALLLLDEPAAGLTRSESMQLGRLLRRLHEEKGKPCWVIDHDMHFLMGLVDYVFVMDSGRLIAQGTPDDVRADALVRRRYLGA